MRALSLCAAATALLGLAIELGADPRASPLLSILDVAVGWALAGAAVALRRRAAGPAGWLLLAAALAWFAGTASALRVAGLSDAGGELLYAHRALLVLAILVVRRRWPPGAPSALVAGAALVSAIPVAAQAGWPVLVAAGGLALAGGHGARPRASTWLLALALALSGVVVLLDAGPETARWALVTYDLLIVGSVATLVSWSAEIGAAVADRVVELGERGPLADALAEVLSDPSIEVLPPGADGCLPSAGDGRALTTVKRRGRAAAAIVHAPGTLSDPQVSRAAVAAARLALDNAELNEEIAGQLDELRGSSRRLLLAGERARSALERRLHAGPERRLALVASLLAELPEAGIAVQQLHDARRELHEFVAGLYPRVLDERGLAGAVGALAGRSPVPVRTSVAPGRHSSAVELTAYFVCAEGLANVAKYAQASVIEVAVSQGKGMLEVRVADDGVGGAHFADAGGLRGLADRVVALGGALSLTSEAGRGTELIARIPLAQEHPRG